MKINLDNIKCYFLTCNEFKKQNIKNEFSKYNLVEVNPIMGISKFRSGVTGFLRIINKSIQKQKEKNTFEPFIILEDDVKKYRDFPNELEIPDDSDILYIGLSKWGITTNPNQGVEGSVKYTIINNDIIKIYNMLATHGLLICSIQGLFILQQCLMEDYMYDRHYDLSICQIQPYYNIYALKKPLVYQGSYLDKNNNIQNKSQEKATKITNIDLIEGIIEEKYINYSNLGSNIIAKHKIGIFGCCIIDDYNILDFKHIKYNSNPYIYENKNFLIYTRPLGYTTTSSDVLQNLKLIKSNEHINITDDFIYKNVLLKHGGDIIIDNLDYTIIVLEICSLKKIIYKKNNLIFPFEIEGNYNDNDFIINTENEEETINNIRQIQKLLKCKIILLPPLIKFKEEIKKGIHENVTLNKIMNYRYDIINRLNKVSNNENIYFLNWNDFINEHNIDKLIEDQFHFTKYGKKYMSEQIFKLCNKIL